MAGCNSHACVIEAPKGMGTNGPCQCLRPLGKENEIALRRRLAQQRSRILGLEKENKALSDEVKILWEEIRKLSSKD